MRNLTLFVLIAALAAVAAPTADAQHGVFVTARAYPAGVVGAVGLAGSTGRFESGIWAGYNLTRRRDWGEHDDERGGGFGGGLESAWFPGSREGGWFMGARGAIWRMEIEWRDDPQTLPGPVRVGETHIVVVQPTLRAGYRLGFVERFRLDVEAALGAEINAHTDGEKVGQGVIFLVGMRLGL